MPNPNSPQSPPHVPQARRRHDGWHPPLSRVGSRHSCSAPRRRSPRPRTRSSRRTRTPIPRRGAATTASRTRRRSSRRTRAARRSTSVSRSTSAQAARTSGSRSMAPPYTEAVGVELYRSGTTAARAHAAPGRATRILHLAAVQRGRPARPALGGRRRTRRRPRRHPHRPLGRCRLEDLADDPGRGLPGLRRLPRQAARRVARVPARRAGRHPQWRVARRARGA